MIAERSGKMPTTSVRRRTSLFSRSCGLLDQIETVAEAVNCPGVARAASSNGIGLDAGACEVVRRLSRLREDSSGRLVRRMLPDACRRLRTLPTELPVAC